MKVRSISGAVLIILMALMLIIGGDFLFAALLVISLIGMFELYRVREMEKTVPAFIGYAACVGYYFCLCFSRHELMMLFFVALMIGLLVCYVAFYPKYKADQITLIFFGLFYVGVMLSFIYRIRMVEGGAFLVWLVIGCSWAADTCAYFVGSKFGRHKIAPQLSPKKSLEGAIGGVVGAALIAMIFAFITAKYLKIFTHPVPAFGLIAAAGAVISMIGDLAASAIKRNYDIKDYGKLIPGHGGILDRFDSVIITAPIIYGLIRLIAK